VRPGRTGTLTALYLMRSWGFGAREAMGWLRIMRPGSVIGPQQHYLCRMEARGCAEDSWVAAALPLAELAFEADGQGLAEEVAKGMERRAAARMGAQREQ
jgi:cell division cycle 14